MAFMDFFLKRITMTVNDIKNTLKSYIRTICYDRIVYLTFFATLISYLYINSAISNNYWIQYQRAGSLADLMISFSENTLILIPFYVLFLLYGLRNEQLFHIKIRYQDKKMTLRIVIISLLNTFLFIGISVCFLLLIGSFFCNYLINFNSTQSEYFIHVKEVNQLTFGYFVLIFILNYIIKLLWNCLAVCILYTKKCKPFIIVIFITIVNFLISKLPFLISFNIFGMNSYEVYKEFNFITIFTAFVVITFIFIFSINQCVFDTSHFYKINFIKWIPIIILTLFSLQNFRNSCHFYLGNDVEMTFGDAILCMFKGTGSLETIKITQLNFGWIFMFSYFGILMCQKMNNEANNFGIQKIIRYKQRYEFWNHQILEMIKLTLMFYVCIYSVSFLYCILFGEISLIPTSAIQQTLFQINIDSIELLPFYAQVILVPFGILLTLGVMTLSISELFTAIHSLIIYTVLVLLPIFYPNDFILTKFLMLENNRVVNTAVESNFGFIHMILCILCMMVLYCIGLMHFKNRDILHDSNSRRKRK